MISRLTEDHTNLSNIYIDIFFPDAKWYYCSLDGIREEVLIVDLINPMLNC